jgi:hypothetical protein
VVEAEAAPVSAKAKEPAPARAKQPAPQRTEPRREERRPLPRRRGDEDDGETPVGLGSHVPAFLLRPAVIKSPK